MWRLLWRHHRRPSFPSDFAQPAFLFQLFRGSRVNEFRSSDVPVGRMEGRMRKSGLQSFCIWRSYLLQQNGQLYSLALAVDLPYSTLL